MQTTDVRCIAVGPDQYAVQVRGDSLIIGYVRRVRTARRLWSARASDGERATFARTRGEAVAQIVAEYARTT